MPDEILVPIGGAAESVMALPTAITLAQALDVGVHLVRVLQVPSGPLAGTANGLGAGHAIAAVRGRADRHLARVAGEIRAAGLQGMASVLEGGDVAGLLLDHARERDARMIVMATRPRSAMERALLGSVADRLMAEAEIPVAVVPAHDSPNQRAFVHAAEAVAGLADAALHAARPVRRILVAIDGSPHALRALSALRAVARAAEEVLLFHVVVPTSLIDDEGPGTSDGGDPLARYDREARDRLQAIATQLRPAIPAIRMKVVTADHAATAITAAASDRGTDLVAMSTRGEGSVKRAVFGSTLTEVLRRARVPVVVVARR